MKAQVYGRPKHIYSIYRKMERKHLAFEEVFDVRAVRIVVDSCSRVLCGAGYRPWVVDVHSGRVRRLHRDAQGQLLSVDPHRRDRAAEAQRRGADPHERDARARGARRRGSLAVQGRRRAGRPVRTQDRVGAPLARAPGEPSDTDKDFLERMRTELFEDRVYALTPKGEVVDLPRGATPLDFAYNVHTDLGHRCRGAKVNGRIVPLDYQVSNGEIDRDHHRQALRAEPRLAGARTGLSRLAAQSFEGARVVPQARCRRTTARAGRQIAERELARLGVKPEHMSALVSELKANDIDQMHQLLGEGEITVTQLVQAAERLTQPAPEPMPRTPVALREGEGGGARKKRGSLVDIEGVGDLPITLARCCAPIRPQAITGYVTLGRGVTIHRSDCPALARMRSVKPERALNVEWSSDDPENLDVQIAITAYDRRGLRARYFRCHGRRAPEHRRPEHRDGSRTPARLT